MLLNAVALPRKGITGRVEAILLLVVLAVDNGPLYALTSEALIADTALAAIFTDASVRKWDEDAPQLAITGVDSAAV